VHGGGLAEFWRSGGRGRPGIGGRRRVANLCSFCDRRRGGDGTGEVVWRRCGSAVVAARLRPRGVHGQGKVRHGEHQEIQGEGLGWLVGTRCERRGQLIGGGCNGARRNMRAAAEDIPYTEGLNLYLKAATASTLGNEGSSAELGGPRQYHAAAECVAATCVVEWGTRAEALPTGSRSPMWLPQNIGVWAPE
jgi:hypothetical protein